MRDHVEITPSGGHSKVICSYLSDWSWSLWAIWTLNFWPSWFFSWERRLVIVRELCAGVVWGFRGACFLLGIRILEHNAGPWGWVTKNASEEVCAYVCLCVGEGRACWHCRACGKRACWAVGLLVGFTLQAKVTVTDRCVSIHTQTAIRRLCCMFKCL